MAWYAAEDQQAFAGRADHRRLAADQLPEEMLAPILAGAYARGIADLLERLAVPAVFLGTDLRVMFANGPMRDRLGRGLAIHVQHLVADAPEDNRALDSMLASLIQGRQPDVLQAVLPAAALSIHAIPLDIAGSSVGQLVRTVLIVDDGRDEFLPALLGRMSSMRSQ